MSEEYDFSDLNFESFSVGGEVTANEEEEAYRLDSGASIAVVDSDQAVCDYLLSMFEGSVDSAFSLSAMESQLGLSSKVVILGPSCAADSELATVERWARDHPQVATILITSELTTQLLHKALRVGVKDVLAAPVNQSQLFETINRVAEGLPVAQELAEISHNEPILDDDGVSGQVISVFSTKGGSGKSVTATNLGVALAKRSSNPVVIIDGHLQFGDVAVMLKLQPKHSVVDAIGQIENLDGQMIQQFMTKHEPSGLLVLSAPLDPMFADQVQGEQMVRLIEVAKSFAGHVIVDLPGLFNEIVLSTIEVSDDLLVIAELDIPNIKNVKVGMQTLEMLNIPKDRIHIVINRADSKVKLDVSEVEKALGIKAIAHIPSDVVVPISVNRSTPVVMSAQKSGVARAFEELALRFSDKDAVLVSSESSSGSSLKKLFG